LKKKTGILLGFEAVRILRRASGEYWKKSIKYASGYEQKSIFS